MMKYMKLPSIAHKSMIFKKQSPLTAMSEEAVFSYSIGYDVVDEHFNFRFCKTAELLVTFP